MENHISPPAHQPTSLPARLPASRPRCEETAMRRDGDAKRDAHRVAPHTGAGAGSSQIRGTVPYRTVHTYRQTHTHAVCMYCTCCGQDPGAAPYGWTRPRDPPWRLRPRSSQPGRCTRRRIDLVFAASPSSVDRRGRDARRFRNDQTLPSHPEKANACKPLARHTVRAWAEARGSTVSYPTVPTDTDTDTYTYTYIHGGRPSLAASGPQKRHQVPVRPDAPASR